MKESQASVVSVNPHSVECQQNAYWSSESGEKARPNDECRSPIIVSPSGGLGSNAHREHAWSEPTPPIGFAVRYPACNRGAGAGE